MEMAQLGKLRFVNVKITFILFGVLENIMLENI